MSSDAARLEALGEPEVRFRWRSHELTIPRALEDWPLDLIRRGQYADAVAVLLDGQTAPNPLWGDLASLSDAMAAAVGVERLPETKPLSGFTWRPDAPIPSRFFGMFGVQLLGAVPMLLGLLDGFEDDVASDLRRFWSVDYLDRFRGGLTLGGIWTYIRRLTNNSALAIARNGGHERSTKQTVVLAQIWEQLARQVNIGRPMTREEIDAALERQRANEQTMDTLAAKQDYYSPEASRARLEAARAKQAQAAARVAAGGPPPDYEPSPAALSALDKAMASRRREISQLRKAG